MTWVKLATGTTRDGYRWLCHESLARRNRIQARTRRTREIERMTISRRRFCATLGTGAAALAGCRLGTTEPFVIGDGRITARPGVAPTTTVAPGIHNLNIQNSGRPCWLVVPANYEPSRDWPMTLFFRGAITPARNYLDSFQPIADEFGVIILAPEATGQTWDLLGRGFGPDVDFINASLEVAFSRVRVDPARLCSSGFSDGATYSLSLGLTNGDVITRIAAYSPGFMETYVNRGQPEVFITHGTRDQVLPVDSSRNIVDTLRTAGYQVEYHEFDGPHVVSLSLTRASFEWMARPPLSSRRG